MLEEAGKFAAEVTFPLNISGDEEGCKLDKTTHEVTPPKGFKEAYAKYVEGGWAALSCDPEYGGQGLPFVVNQCLYEMLNSANQAWTMLKKPAGERLKLLREAEGAEARFLWAILRDQFHYAAVHLESIAETARDIDFAMRWGFGSKQGPFELWQQAGWKQVATWIQEDIDAGKALSKAPLPEWVFKGPVAEAGGVHTAEGSWGRALPVFSSGCKPRRVVAASAGG